MGPITLFDKSFLQSLSVDESVWFDHFFLTNVSPLFYVETLADLEKSVREGRTPEQEVGLIADKFPEMHGAPSAHHTNLCISNLLGHAVPMTGQILLAGGRKVNVSGRSGSVFEQSPEAEAFSRWREHEFLEIERQYAQSWRRALSALDLRQVTKRFRALGIDGKSCRNLEDASALATSAVATSDRPSERMKLGLLFRFLNVPWLVQQQILKGWSIANYPPLVEYAPYAAYVLTVEMFFQIALATNLISGERPSNRVDIAYLFYLPFCMMFASCDRLHERCTPLFLRRDQGFVWGQELKDGLGQLNTYYSQLPDSTKQKGVLSFAAHPPKSGDFFVTRLWDQSFPGWREINEANRSDRSEANSKVLEEIKEMEHAPPLSRDQVDYDSVGTDHVLIKRRVRIIKGSWYQVPKDLEAPEDHQ